MPPLEPDWNDEERELLRSAELDTPEPHAHQRTLAALGIGGAALSGAIATGSAKAAGLAAPSAAMSGAAAGGGKALAWIKLLGLMATVGAAGGVVLHYRDVKSQHAIVAPAPATNQALVPSHTVSPPVETQKDAVTTTTETTPPSDTPPSSVKTLPAAGAAHAEPDITLEIEALDRARRASEHGNFSAALHELDSYDHNFKQGRLRPEALLLRVQTLLNSGDAAGAKALGTRFLAKYPKSPLSPRIQKLIGSSK
jgi:TolA-binding protein